MQSLDIACTVTAQVFSPIYMIYVVSFDVVAEKKKVMCNFHLAAPVLFKRDIPRVIIIIK